MEKTAKKAYQPPQMTVFGKVEDLTEVKVPVS
jgi:hypothetical protein